MNRIKVLLSLLVVLEVVGGIAFFVNGVSQDVQEGPLHYGIIVSQPQAAEYRFPLEYGWGTTTAFWVDLYQGSTECRQDLFVWGNNPWGVLWANGTGVGFYWESSFYGLVHQWHFVTEVNPPTGFVLGGAQCYDGSDPL